MSGPVCATCGGAVQTGANGGWCPRCALGAAEAADAAGLFALPGYEVQAEIGRGATGIVYRARQEHPAREVALKILRPHEASSPEARARFRLEAELVAGLDHPGLLPVFDVGEHDGLPFFTMKHCAGGTLAARLGDYAHDRRRAAELVAQLAEAVQHAHDRGVLHRDLKPGNVFFDEAGRAFVGDFGLAKAAATEERLTRPHLVYGTPGYLAPEVAQHGARAATVAADVYGLGAILVELLTGAPPTASGEVARQEWPHDLRAVVARAVAPEPRARYGSAAALAADLRAWVAGREVSARLPSAAERLGRWVRRNPLAAGLAAGLAVALGVGAAMLWRKNVELRDALAASLLDQSARARASGWAGRRAAALATAERAAELRPSEAAESSRWAAAALTDFEREREMPALAGRLWVAVDGEMRRFVHVDQLRGGDLRAHDGAGREVAAFAGAPAMLPLTAAYSADGQWFAATFLDHENRRSGFVWAAAGGAPIWRSAPGFVTLAWEGARAAWVALAADGELTRVEAAAPTLPRPVARAGFAAAKLAVSAAGDAVALVGAGRVQVRELADGRVRWDRSGNFAETAPAWRPDGRVLAAIREDAGNTIDLLGAAEGATWRTLTEPGSGLRRVEFGPDGRLFAVERDDVLTVWSLGRGRVELRMRLAERNVALSADRRRMVVMPAEGRGAIYAWRSSAVWQEWPAGWDGPRGTPVELVTVAASPNGRWVVALDDGGVTAWDVTRPGAPARAVRGPSYAASLTFNRRGDAVIYADMAQGVYRRALVDGPVGVNFEPEEVLVATPGWRVLPQSAHGDRLFAYDMKIRVHEVAESGPWTPVRWFDTGMTSIEKRGSVDDAAERVFVVNQQTGRATVRFRSGAPAQDLGPVAVESVGRFAADGRTLWVLGGGELRRFDCTDWRETGRWPVAVRNMPRPWLVFAPDGRTVAVGVGDGAVELRDMRDGRRRLTLQPPHALRNYQAAWAPDGGTLWLSADTGELYGWRLAGAAARE